MEAPEATEAHCEPEAEAAPAGSLSWKKRRAGGDAEEKHRKNGYEGGSTTLLSH